MNTNLQTMSALVLGAFWGAKRETELRASTVLMRLLVQGAF